MGRADLPAVRRRANRSAEIGRSRAEKIGQSTDGGVYAKLLARPLASMSTMRSAGVEFWALLLNNPVGDRGKIATWLTKIAETVDLAGLLRADKKSWVEVKCVADDPKGGG